MKVTTAFLLLLISTSLPGQSTTGNKIVGEWLSEKVMFIIDETLPDTTSQESQMLFKMTRDCFTGAKFIFGNDGIFRFKIPTGVKNVLTEEFSAMNGKNWSRDSKENTIDIGGQENLLSIELGEKDGAQLFHLYGTPIVLVMKKVER